jgi:hypothetical protein
MSEKTILQLEAYIEELEMKLQDAEKVIEFYADINNWSYQQIIDDVSDVNGSLEAGKRAREYKKKWSE